MHSLNTSVRLPVQPFACPSVPSSVRPSICPFIHPSVRPAKSPEWPFCCSQELQPSADPSFHGTWVTNIFTVLDYFRICLTYFLTTIAASIFFLIWVFSVSLIWTILWLNTPYLFCPPSATIHISGDCCSIKFPCTKPLLPPWFLLVWALREVYLAVLY